jgi:Bacterial Ig-like domain (group 2)
MSFLRLSAASFYYALGCSLLVLATGCGGGSSSGSSGGSSSVSISISPTTATVPSGGTQQFQATVTGSSNTGVTWQVNNVNGGSTQTGTISSSGLYTAPTTDVSIQATITAVSAADSSKKANASVTVTGGTGTLSVGISPATATVGSGQTQQFTATVTGTTNTGVTWSVDGVAGGNTTVGTINTSGLYTAPSTAAAHTVTATSVADTTKSANAAVSVISMTISPQTASLAPNGTCQFTATVQGSNNQGVAWLVDGVAGGNTTVGTISSNGLYTAPNQTGSHTITATANVLPSYGVNATANVVNAPPGTAEVTTYHNDDVRSGVNPNETILNPSNVNPGQFGKLAALTVDGQIYAQPLYVPNVTIGGALHNVVFVATENDSVYAFDADGLSNSPLWMKHLGTPLSVHDQEGIEPLLGITSTPVIDTNTSTIYVLTDGSENGHKVYRLHAMSLATGAEKFGGPVVVTGSVAGSGWDSQNGRISLETSCYQRDGLAMNPATNSIYISFGHCSHGWILAYDKASLQQTAIMNVTPDGAGGGLWGGTPAIDDSTGDMYIISGVDIGDPAPDYNDSALRLRGGDLSILDYFKPSNETYLRQNDADFGSGAAIIMPDNPSPYPHELIGGGKDGRIFVMNRDNMGGYQQTDHVIQEVQTGTQQFDNIFATPTYWNGTIYYHCENDVVKAFNWDANTGLLSNNYTMKGNDVYGTHGATSSLSSNGSSDGILWEIEATNAENGANAILHAYDATNLQNELYKSSSSGGRDTAGPGIKFSVPTIADGHVFVGTQTELDIYGLLQ